MRLFGTNRGREAPQVADGNANTIDAAPLPKRARRKTGRSTGFSVRVGADFKTKFRHLLAELQLERLNTGVSDTRITDGELLEQMLSAMLTARRDSREPLAGHALPPVVLQGIQLIAAREGLSPARVIEQLVAKRLEELGLVSSP